MNLTRMASRWEVLHYVSVRDCHAESQKGRGARAHGTHEAAQVNACPLLWLVSRVVDVRAAGCCVPLAVFGVTCGDRDHTHVHTFKVQFVGGSSRE